MVSRRYTPLFNGTDLSGWRNPYSHGEASVVDGEIHLLAGVLVEGRPVAATKRGERWIVEKEVSGSVSFEVK